MRRLHGKLTEWMEEADLAVRTDPVGNLIGHYPGLRPESRVLMIGSHLDSVPDAGKYDGPLGVLLGLAAVQALGGRRLPFGIDVIAFSDEEGVRYRAPFLGSLAVCGRFDRATAGPNRPRRNHHGGRVPGFRARSVPDRPCRVSRRCDPRVPRGAYRTRPGSGYD